MSAPATVHELKVQEYRVSFAQLRELIAGQDGVDLEPIVADGKQVALRVIGVRPGSAAARLGARTGDTIETVNGLPLTSIANAYKAGDEAIQQSQIVIRGKRGGVAYETVLHVEGAAPGRSAP